MTYPYIWPYSCFPFLPGIVPQHYLTHNLVTTALLPPVHIAVVLRYFEGGHVWFTCSHHRCQDAFCLVVRLDTGWIFFDVASAFDSWYDVFPAIGIVVSPLAPMLLATRHREHACKYLAFCLILLCFIRFFASYSHCEYVKVMIMFWSGVSFVFHWFYKGSPLDRCKSQCSNRLDGRLISLILLVFIRVLASYSHHEYLEFWFLLVFPTFFEEFSFPTQKSYMPSFSIA